MTPICENIGDASQRIEVGTYFDDWLYRSGKAALEK
jgi:hypothetical protein